MNIHNNINDSNSNNNYEYLFWLVFRNKFILNKIIHYIQTIEWVKYDDHSQLHINNRLKLNDTHSLGLMIKNKLYSLLNYKLDNNHNIDIDRYSIYTLFRQLSINNNNNKDDINTLKEILIKLLSNRRDEFEITDLTLEAVECNSIEVLRILINETYSIPIYPSTLEYAIEHCHPSIVELILNSTTTTTHISTTTSTSIINTTSLYLNENEDDDNNGEQPKKKFKPTPPSPLSDSQQQQQQQSPSSSSSFSNSSSSSSSSSVNNGLSIEVISLKLKHLVENLTNFNLSYENVISIYKILYTKDDDKISTKTTTTAEIMANSNSNDDYDSKIKMKQLETLIILKLKQVEELKEYYDKFYEIFIRKYKEIIEECHKDDDEVKLNDEGVKQQLLRFKQFSIIANLLFDGMNNNKDVISDCINGSLVWNDLLFDMVIRNTDEEGPVLIHERSTIDWLLNCRNKTIRSFVYCNFDTISFSTLELADYVYKESGLLNHLANKDIEEPLFNRFIYTYVWKEAIKQSDYNTLKYIESLGIDDIHTLSFYKSTPQLTINQLLTLIQYLNETGFNGFGDESNFDMFFSTLERVFIDENKDDVLVGKEMLSNIKLNFKIENSTFIHQESLEKILLESIMEMELYRVILLLNSNIFNNSRNIDYNDIINQDQILLNNLNQCIGVIFDRKFINGNKVDYVGDVLMETDIVEIINKLIKLVEQTNNTNSSNIDPNDAISVMVNYFFERLIRLKGITMESVQSVYQLIQQHSIIIRHTVYHSYWYLHIKDIRLSLFILNPQMVDLIYQDRDEDESYNCLEYDERLFNLQDFINESDFTFESIHSLPFDTLLEMLDNHKSPLNNSYHNKLPDLMPINIAYFSKIIESYLNKDLEYYLIIRRIDLFFKKLHQIKCKLDLKNSNLKNNNYNANSYLFRETIQYNNIELLGTPSTTLLPNSTLFKNNNNNTNIGKETTYQFVFCESVLECCCTILNIDDIIKVIQFNFNVEYFQKTLLSVSLKCHRYDIAKLIIDNFKITLDKYVLLKASNSFIINNYFHLFKPPCYQGIFENYNSIQHQSNHPCIGCNYNNQEDNIFLSAFGDGNIKLCELILSKYSNYQFKLTKQSITTAINNNNIHIINHFKKNHINMLNDNQDLINHLNNELNSRLNNYKYK